MREVLRFLRALIPVLIVALAVDPGVVGPTVGISYAMLGATVAGLGAGFIAVLVLALRGALTKS